MIGLVIATHSNLAAEFLRASEMIIGPLQQARAVCVCREDSVEAIERALAAAIGEVGAEGTLIMTDMFGGTPSNVSFAFLGSSRVEVLTGVNLPMVLKFFHCREGLSLAELTGKLKVYGQQGIKSASEFLQH